MLHEGKFCCMRASNEENIHPNGAIYNEKKDFGYLLICIDTNILLYDKHMLSFAEVKLNTIL